MNRMTKRRRLESAGSDRIDWLMSRPYPLTKPERIELKRLLEQDKQARTAEAQQ